MTVVDVLAIASTGNAVLCGIAAWITSRTARRLAGTLARTLRERDGLQRQLDAVSITRSPASRSVDSRTRALRSLPPLRELE